MAKTIKELEKEIKRLRELIPDRKLEIYEDAVRPDGTHYHGKLIRRE